MELVSSPAARALVELHARAADGEVTVGGRAMQLVEGAVVALSPGPGDAPVLDHLERAGLLPGEAAGRVAEGLKQGGDLRALVEGELRAAGASPDAYARGRRACWVDRLVQALEAADAAPTAPATVRPVPTGDLPAEPPEPLVPLLLDALALRAGEHDAGAVGQRPAHRLRWMVDGGAEEARRWALLDEAANGSSLATLLVRHPGAASRIAALVRAGFVRLEDPDAAPAPAPRAYPGEPPTGRTRKSSLEPPRPATLELAPGAGARLDDDARPLETELRLPPLGDLELDDPLAPLEARVAELEQAGAPGPERARAWSAVAACWTRDFGSLEEAARAYREAAAAHPQDLVALLRAGELCAATGKDELAAAYARAAVRGATRPEDLGAALGLEAHLHLRAGRHEEACASLKAASDTVPGDPELAARLARLAAESPEEGELATRAAHRAVEQLSLDQPARARALLAAVEGPSALVMSCQLLADEGHGEAAVERLARAAEAETDLERRRDLRLEAVDLAEVAGRPDLALQPLLAQHLDEAHLEVLVEALALDAARAMDAATDGEVAWSAVLLEHAARVGPAPQRGKTLALAGDAFARLPGGASWAAELRALALEAAPATSSALRALRAHADTTRDSASLADALERGARAGGAGAPALLRELAALAETRLGSAKRAAWAWSRLAELDPEDAHARTEAVRLGKKARVKGGLVRLAEEDLEAADAAARPAAARRLAALLRDDPEQRARAIRLYREARAGEAMQAGRAPLERLLRLAGDAQELRTHLEEEVARSSGRDERLVLLGRLASQRMLAGELGPAADATVAWLELAPGSVEAVARLDLLARLLGDAQLAARAEDALLGLPRQVAPRRQAECRARRARAHLAAEDVESARREADAALDADPRSAPAARVLADAWAAPPKPHALAATRAALARAHGVLGDSSRRAAAAARLARPLGDPRLDEEVARWRSLAPLDIGGAMEALDLALTTSPRATSALASAGAWALHASGGAFAPGLEGRVVAAIEGLMDAGAGDDATQLALTAADTLGRPGLLERVSPDAPELRLALLERRVAWAPRDSRLEPLAQLAALHRAQGSAAGEVRAHLRALAIDAHAAAPLARLTELYAAHGETPRLLAVLSLELERSSDAERHDALLRLAAVAARAEDPAAEGFLLQAIAEAPEPEGRVREAAGVLVAAGQTAKAVAFLQSIAADVTAPPVRRAAATERAVRLADETLGEATEALEIVRRALADGVRSPALVLTFERLALAAGDVEGASATYAALRSLSVGRHGRRGVVYREARWLERAGAADAALEAYERAFREAPAAGAILRALERLATVTGRWAPLAEAYALLADQQRVVDRRVELELAGAALLEGRMGSPDRAFDRLHGLWRATGRSTVYPELRRLQAVLGERDPQEGERARRALVEGLRARIEMTWDVADHVRTYRELARLAVEGGDLEAAERIVMDELVPTAEKNPDEVEESEVAEALAELASWRESAPAPDEESPEARHAKAPGPAVSASADAGAVPLAPATGTPAARAPEPRDTPKADATPTPRASPALDPAELGGEAIPFPHKAAGEEWPEGEERAPVDTAADDTAADDTAADDTAADDTAADDTAADGTAADGTAADDTAPDDTAADGTAADDTAADDTAADDTAPVDTAADDPAPGDTAPGDPAAEDTAPGDTAAEDTAPGDTAPSGAAAAAAARNASQRPAPVYERAAIAHELQPGTDVAQSHRPPPSDRPGRWRAAQRQAPRGAEVELRARFANGDIESGLTLGQRLMDEGRDREAVAPLLRVVRGEPWRAEAIRTLQRASEASRSVAIASVCATLRSLFDRREAAPEPLRLRAWSDFVGSPRGLISPSPSPWLEALGVVWEHGASLFQRSLDDLGYGTADRVNVGDKRPSAQVLATASSLLGTEDVELRVLGHSEGIEVLPTAPTVVLFAVTEERERSDLLAFRLGRAFELARAPHVLLATQGPDDLETLLAALDVAFGSPIGSVPREVGAQARELWSALPPKAQARLRTLLADAGPAPSLAGLVEEVAEAGARAGFLLEGSLLRGLQALAHDDPNLDRRALATEEGYASTLRHHAPFRALVRAALSDAHLAARAPLLRASIAPHR